MQSSRQQFYREINAKIISEWDEDNHSIYALQYDNSVPTFIKALKGEASISGCEATASRGFALALAADLLSQCVERFRAEVFEEHQCRFIAAVPSHQKGPALDCAELLCGMVADCFAELHHSKGALIRTETVLQSHKVQTCERPTHTDHSSTLRYAGPCISGTEGLLLLDDVRRKGETSQACIHEIMETTGCSRESIIRLFLART